MIFAVLKQRLLQRRQTEASFCLYNNINMHCLTKGFPIFLAITWEIIIEFIKYVGPPFCRAIVYDGHIACCPLVSYSEYADGWMTDCYITLSARCSQHNNFRPSIIHPPVNSRERAYVNEVMWFALLTLGMTSSQDQ